MGKGKTQTYYDKNPAANKKRLEQQSRYQKSGHGLKIRLAANKADIESKKNGTGEKGDEKDNSHVTDKNGKKKTVLTKQSTNRAGLGIHRRRKPRN